MDEAFIYVSVISGIFGLIGLQLLTHNWFRKERFKFETYNLKKQNDLQLKKMARDMGISSTPPHTNSTPAAGAGIGALLNNPDALNTILGLIGGGNQEEEQPANGGAIQGLLEFANQNPELAEGFIKGVLPALKNKLPSQEGGGDGFIGN